MNKISTLLILGTICLIIAWLIYDYSIVKNNIGIMQAVLFGLLFIAFIIFSNINFRDSSRNLIFNKKAKTAKLYMVIGLFLIPLVMLSGVTIVNGEEVESGKLTSTPTRIETSTDGFSKQLDTVEDSLRNHIDSSAVKKFNDLIIMLIPFLISILCMGVGIAIVYISLLNRKWPSLKDGFPAFAAVFLILIGILGLVEAKRSLQDWVTALGAAALLAIIIIRYNFFNRSEQESIKVNKKGDESSAEQELQPTKNSSLDALKELKLERRMMDRIQQRITVFTTTLALFGGLVGLFGYISLLNIEDTANNVDQMRIKAEEIDKEMDGKVKEVDSKVRAMEKEMDSKVKEMDSKVGAMEKEVDIKAREMKEEMDSKTQNIVSGYEMAMNMLVNWNEDVEKLTNEKVTVFSTQIDSILKSKIEEHKKYIAKAVTDTLNYYAKMDEVNEKLKDKVTIDTLNTRLRDYAMKSELKDKVTIDTLNTRLRDYAMKSELKDKVTIDTLNTRLNKYQKKQPE